MTLLKKMCEKIILIIITISILIMFCATPASYAKLDLKDGEFYYAGTTKGTYTVKDGIFSWLLDNIGQIADWLLGIITMGFRMVFVGWTALLEKLLTWALETTAGVNIAGKEIDGMSSTDLTSITDSSGNVTVQAIVYNQVPAFDINFFNNEYDKTVSGTGMKYKCDKCDKNSEECCSETGCSCECKGNCDGCKKYLEALAIDQENNPPIVVQIKNLVATWYYIMRFLSIAAMLVVLIGIGIKMAISTIASEKAVYKRMLVDWVIGIIILFSIHYFMIFIIHINDYLVETIKNAANEVNTVEMKQLSGTDAKIEKTNEDIEIDVYEATRTRAYDAKLSNGLTGMIMYMTLVYFAIRYSIVYIKRYLTLIVLTLMGPPVGVAYALQKVFSGKSSTLKTWMTEYIMNVIIQTVHAIIYGVFISTALVLSLESVAGTIVALILMNYGLKAEKTFRKIFKMGESDSLLGHTADAENMKKNLDMMAGLYVGAKPAAKALMNTPYAKALKGVGKIGAVGVGGLAAGGVKIGRAAKDKFGKSEAYKFEREVDKEMDKNYGGSEFKRDQNGRDAETEEQYEDRRNKAKQAVLARRGEHPVVETDTSIKELMEKGKDTVKSELVEATNNLAQNKHNPKAKENFKNSMSDYAQLMAFQTTTSDIVKAKGRRIVDIENNYTLGTSYSPFQNIQAIFGTSHKDMKTGKYVPDHNGYYELFKPTNLLGFTDADKKMLKENVLTPIRNGFGGMVAMFVGMGTMIAHPTLGMGLLAGGATLAGKTFVKPAKDRKYKGTYGFSRFSTPALRDIEKAAIARANREWDNLVRDNIKNNHPDLYGALNAGNIDLKENGRLGNKFKAVAGFGPKMFIESTGISSNIDAISVHAAKQMRQQQLEFMEEYLNTQVSINAGVMKNKENKEELNFMIKEFKELGFEYDPETNTFTAIDKEDLDQTNTKTEDENKDLFDTIAQTMVLQSLETNDQANQTDNNTGPILKTSFSEEFKQKVGDHDLEISDSEFKVIDKSIDQAIITALMAQGKTELNSNFENKVIDDIDKRTAGALKDKKVLDLFKGKETELRDVIKNRAAELKVQNPYLTLSNEEKSDLQAAVNELTDGKQDFSELKTEDVMEKMKASEAKRVVSSSDGSRQVDSQKDGSVQLKGAVEKYIEALQSSKTLQPRPSKTEQEKISSKENKKSKVSLDEAKKTVEEKVKTRRKKIDQVLALDGFETIDDAISSKQNSQGEDSSHILELLLMRKELETLNEFGAKELELKSGVSGYKDSVKDKSKKAVAYYKAELDVQNFEMKHRQFYEKDGTRKPQSEIEKILNDKEKSKEVDNNITKNEELKGTIGKLKQDMEKAERELKTKGPIININETIKAIHSENIPFMKK